MALTKQETKEVAITAPLTGFVAGAGTIVATDTILLAMQKLQGNDAVATTQIGALQVGNNLFNYYNFK